jgi:hypothetical protein
MRTLGLCAVKTLIVVSLPAVAGGCSGSSKQLSKTDIQLAASDLRTFAASAQMLVEQCSTGRATEIFCREQSDLLSSKIDDSLHALDGQGGPSEYERKQLFDIGATVREIVLRVEASSNVPRDAADARRLSLLAKTLEDTLRK